MHSESEEEVDVFSDSTDDDLGTESSAQVHENREITSSKADRLPRPSPLSRAPAVPVIRRCLLWWCLAWLSQPKSPQASFSRRQSSYCQWVSQPVFCLHASRSEASGGPILKPQACRCFNPDASLKVRSQCGSVSTSVSLSISVRLLTLMLTVKA
uniref:Uncharacterized protein n=1 Tax=Ditylenchus dipsaci TaxID=166011 RepID=A0A915DNZ8_9BILA